MNPDRISRRLLLKRAAVLGLLAAMERLVPAYALTSAANAGSQIAAQWRDHRSDDRRAVVPP